MPRPRKHRRLPNGIKPDAVPQHVSWDEQGARWVLRWKDPETGKLRSRRVGGQDATLRSLMDASDAILGQIAVRPTAETMSALVDAYRGSADWRDLAPTTKKDYGYAIQSILGAETKGGAPVGETLARSWTPVSVRQYVDRRGESSRSRANKELRVLSILFAWGRERGLVESNPAERVKSLRVTTKARYVTDAEYEAFLAFAGQRFPYIPPAAEIAYLCRMRLAEVLSLRRSDLHEDGVWFDRRKNSRDGIATWTPRLRAAIDAALELHGKIAGLYVVRGASNGRMPESTFKTAWGRSMREWAAQGGGRFMFHDLKRKGVTDMDGDKLAASGHRSASMLKVYDLSRAKAPATR